VTNGVDVIMLTRNSERILRKCLASVYDNVPVRKLIVVDGYSTDRTLEIVEEFQGKYGNVVVIRDKGTRGGARQRSLREVNADWFMFVDSDVILCDDWFVKAEKLIKDNVGAVWGMEIWSVLRNSRLLKLFERITLKIFQSRGGTHDLLVRRKALEGISIPSHLHTYEDSYIKSYIKKKGYDVVAVYDPYCLHYRPEDVWTIRQSIGFIASDLKLALGHVQLLLSYAFYTVIVLYESLSRSIAARRSRE
jgi:glycosyltransferase involved in cell wall biosynthesis